MTDIDIVGDKIRFLIRTVMGMPDNTVRPAYQNAPTGTNDEPYATVLLTNYVGEGWDANRLKNNPNGVDVDSDTVGQRRVTAQVQFYRANACVNAARLGALMQQQSAIQLMSETGIGLVRIGQVTNVSKVINTKWEEQASLNVDFHVLSLATETLAALVEFPIAVTPDTPAGTLQTLTVEVFEP